MLKAGKGQEKGMNIEILLATMFYEKEENFLEKMNVKTDIVIGNQTNYDSKEEYAYNESKVTILSRSERGVGKNRNTCLFNSTADIVLFADNDVKYYDDYKEKIENYYEKHPDADIVIFNFKMQRESEPLHDINHKNKRAKLRDITKFGTVTVTARRESILRKRISFSLLFGGGAKYSCGEDSLFLTDCYKAGLRIYLSSDTLGEVINKESTWFKGITEKYVFDKGVLFKAMCPKIYKLVIIRHVIKHRKLYKEYGSVKKVLRVMLNGAKDYKG